MSDNKVRNPNEIRDLMFITLSLAEYTKVPFLYMGNPGIAKTTGVELWAEKYGYKVTTLIGSQRVAEEILGFMINDDLEKKLLTRTPDWFDDIIKNSKNGFKTLLFIDELSQAPELVQGAMLRLIQGRCVGGIDNSLPEDCLVVAAANYKGNIPPQCTIQAPTLNRFCIINVEPQDGPGLVIEFTQSDEERNLKIPSFVRREITTLLKDTLRKKIRQELSSLFESFSSHGDNLKELNIHNTEINEIFEQHGPVYNFFSGRIISYIQKICIGIIHLDIARLEYNSIIRNIAFGLAGAGTCSFSSEESQNQYLEVYASTFLRIIKTTISDHLKDLNSGKINFNDKSVEDCISDWMRHIEGDGSINDVNLERLMKVIQKKYPTDAESMLSVLQTSKIQKFLADIQKINTLYEYINTSDILEIKNFAIELKIIVDAYNGYKMSALNALV